MGLKHALLTFLIALLCDGFLQAQAIYVSPQGNDNSIGSRKQPIATFAKAHELVRKSKEENAKVVFLPGTYYLPETVRFTSQDNKSSVVYMAEKEGTVVISGGKRLNLRWQKTSKAWYTATIPAGSVIDQLYINGERQRMARFPNAVGGKNVFDTWDLSHSM